MNWTTKSFAFLPTVSRIACDRCNDAIVNDRNGAAEDLQLDGNRNYPPFELAQADVQRVIGENESHVQTPGKAVTASIKNQDHLEQKRTGPQSLLPRLPLCLARPSMVATTRPCPARYGLTEEAFFEQIGRTQLNAALRIGQAIVLASSLLAGTAFAAEGDRNPLAEPGRRIRAAPSPT